VAQVEEFPEDEVKYALREGDLLLVEGHASPREIGRCARVTREAVGYLHQNHLFRLRSVQLLPKFSDFWLNSAPVRAYWRTAAATSSGLYTISRKAVTAIPFPVVDLQVQRRVVAELDLFDELIANEVDELAKIRAVKQGLVDDLLPGRVPVPAMA
jgi:type I restriction enzyme S subunit